MNDPAKREEIELLCIQLQRTLVLWVLQLYSHFESATWHSHYHSFINNLIYSENSEETERFYLWLHQIHHRPLIRVALGLHKNLDHTRSLKAFLMTLILWIKYFAYRLWPNLFFGNYQKWIIKEKHSRQLKALQWQQRVDGAARPPFFCIIIFLTDIESLPTLLNSIVSQRYPHFLLFLVVEPPLRAVCENLLVSYPSLNSKIFVRTTAWEIPFQPKQEKYDLYLCIQRPGCLAESALWEIATHYLDNPESTKIWYGDEDSIDSKKRRTNPIFYPAWDWDYHLAKNVLGRMCCIKKETWDSLVKEANKNQDLDFSILQCLYYLKKEEILHIPSVLFHCSLSPKFDTYLWQKTVAQFLPQKIPDINLTWQSPDRLHIQWPIPDPVPKVSIIIPTKDRVDLLSLLINGLLYKTKYPIEEIVIVDNRSTESATANYLKNLTKTSPIVKVLPYDHPFNYSAINNYAFQHSSGDIIAFLNNDIEIIHEEWLEEMVRQICRSDVGIVGAKLLYKNKFIQHAGVAMGIGQVAGHPHLLGRQSSSGYNSCLTFVHACSAVTGACLVTKRLVFEKLGGFNSQDLAVAYNDVDLCLRTQQLGFRVVWTPFAELYHHESASRPIDTTGSQLARYRSEVRYMREHWQSLIASDPYWPEQLARNGYYAQLKF